MRPPCASSTSILSSPRAGTAGRSGCGPRSRRRRRWGSRSCIISTPPTGRGAGRRSSIRPSRPRRSPLRVRPQAAGVPVDALGVRPGRGCGGTARPARPRLGGGPRPAHDLPGSPANAAGESPGTIGRGRLRPRLGAHANNAAAGTAPARLAPGAYAATVRPRELSAIRRAGAVLVAGHGDYEWLVGRHPDGRWVPTPTPVEAVEPRPAGEEQLRVGLLGNFAHQSTRASAELLLTSELARDPEATIVLAGMQSEDLPDRLASRRSGRSSGPKASTPRSTASLPRWSAAAG